MSFKFALDSDIHFGSKINQNGRLGIRDDKFYNVANILKLKTELDLAALITIGDLTDDGYDGKQFLCWQYGGNEDQLTPLLKEYVNPLSAALPLYMSIGNHDTYVMWPYLHHPVRDLVLKMYKSLTYSFDIKGVHFIGLGIYPSKALLPWLKKELEANAEKPIILWYHYNMYGDYSDFWTEDEKQAFFEVIEDYRSNIKALLVGHNHVTYVGEWRGFKVISPAGEGFMICNYDAETQTVDAVQYLNRPTPIIIRT